VSEGFDQELRVEAVRLELLPWPRIRVERVELEELGSAREAEVDLCFRPLLRGRVEARSVLLIEPRLVLRRGPDGDFLPLFRGRGGPGPAAMPRFEAEGGEIRVVQGEKLTTVVRLAALSLGHFDADGGAELVLTGNVTGGNGRWHAHPLHLRGRLVHGAERTVLLDGRARAEHVGASWWRGHNARARFRYEDGRIHLQLVEVRAFGGSWRAEGQARLRGGMQWELTAGADAVSLSDLAAAMDPGSRPGDLGVLRMRFRQLIVPWRSGPRWETATGVGRVNVAGGVLRGRSLLASVLGAEPVPNAVTSLRATVDLHDGRLYSDDLRLETADYLLEARGSLGLDRTLALEGHATLAGAPDLPVSIAGTLGEPAVDAHPSRLPGHGIGALASGVKKTGTGMARALGAAKHKAWGLMGGEEDAPAAQ